MSQEKHANPDLAGPARGRTPAADQRARVALRRYLAAVDEALHAAEVARNARQELEQAANEQGGTR